MNSEVCGLKGSLSSSLGGASDSALGGSGGLAGSGIISSILKILGLKSGSSFGFVQPLILGLAPLVFLILTMTAPFTGSITPFVFMAAFPLVVTFLPEILKVLVQGGLSGSGSGGSLTNMASSSSAGSTILRFVVPLISGGAPLLLQSIISLVPGANTFAPIIFLGFIPILIQVLQFLFQGGLSGGTSLIPSGSSLGFVLPFILGVAPLLIQVISSVMPGGGSISPNLLFGLIPFIFQIIQFLVQGGFSGGSSLIPSGSSLGFVLPFILGVAPLVIQVISSVMPGGGSLSPNLLFGLIPFIFQIIQFVVQGGFSGGNSLSPSGSGWGLVVPLVLGIVPLLVQLITTVIPGAGSVAPFLILGIFPLIIRFIPQILKVFDQSSSLPTGSSGIGDVGASLPNISSLTTGGFVLPLLIGFAPLVIKLITSVAPGATSIGPYLIFSILPLIFRYLPQIFQGSSGGNILLLLLPLLLGAGGSMTPSAPSYKGNFLIYGVLKKLISLLSTGMSYISPSKIIGLLSPVILLPLTILKQFPQVAWKFVSRIPSSMQIPSINSVLRIIAGGSGSNSKGSYLQPLLFGLALYIFQLISSRFSGGSIGPYLILGFSPLIIRYLPYIFKISSGAGRSNSWARYLWGIIRNGGSGMSRASLKFFIPYLFKLGRISFYPRRSFRYISLPPIFLPPKWVSMG